jgi:hypothetical protein
MENNSKIVIAGVTAASVSALVTYLFMRSSNELIEEHSTIMNEIRANYKPWANVDNGSVTLRRLSGLSNACYKVAITKGNLKIDHKVILFRRFENKICDATFEHLVFKSMSD